MAAKRQRLHSAVTKPAGDGDDEHDDDPSNDNNSKASERTRRVVAPYTQKDTMARSRRMFGALMGHLGKAKAQLERDSDLFKRQNSKQQEAEQREKNQSKTLEEKAKRGATIQKLEKLIARTELDMAEQLARVKLEHLQSVRKAASLSKFLQTIASPPIYYLPAKHTKETDDLVAASKEAHEEKMQIRTREHQVRLHELEAEFQSKLEKYREQLEEAKQEATKNPEKAGADGEQVVEEEEKGESKSEKGEGTVSNDEAMDADAAGSKGIEVQKQESNENAEMSDADSPEIKTDRDDADNKNAEAGTPVKEELATPQCPSQEDEHDANAGEESKPSTKPEEQPASADAIADEEVSGETDTVKEEAGASQSPSEQENQTDVKPEPVKSKSLETPVKQKVDLSKLKVAELREQLKKRGLDTKGLKSNLLERLEEAMDQEAA
uniref:SAP domain-containing protein n=1 Tax=Globisporangium ultimum (strain ATCC 200006 / CBS 805.95 / DAOM BR144) TaxID=431595 RepID=K3WSI8_GLOUD